MKYEVQNGGRGVTPIIKKKKKKKEHSRVVKPNEKRIISQNNISHLTPPKVCFLNLARDLLPIPTDVIKNHLTPQFPHNANNIFI